MTNLESPPHPPLDQKSDAELNAVGCGIDDDDVGGIPSGPWDAERSEHSLEDGERCVRALPGTGGTADEDTNHQVTQPKEGLSSFAASLIVVNYMSAAYLLLPGCKWTDQNKTCEFSRWLTSVNRSFEMQPLHKEGLSCLSWCLCLCPFRAP